MKRPFRKRNGLFYAVLRLGPYLNLSKIKRRKAAAYPSFLVDLKRFARFTTARGTHAGTKTVHRTVFLVNSCPVRISAKLKDGKPLFIRLFLVDLKRFELSTFRMRTEHSTN